LVENKGNFLILGNHNYNNIAVDPLFTPADAQNIDTKIDDGLPSSGDVFGSNIPGCYMEFFFDKP
jgi:hypothetical protein